MKWDRQKKIQSLSDWEWTTLIGSWRYYETRRSIVAATFPADIVERFWGSGRYADFVLDRIARQFAVVDHGTNGEEDWAPASMPVGYEPWAKFYAFCKAWSDTERGFVLVRGRDGFDVSLDFRYPPSGLSRIRKLDGKAIPCFRCATNGRLYPAAEYILHPRRDIFMNERMVEECGYDGDKSWWGKSQRICR